MRTPFLVCLHAAVALALAIAVERNSRADEPLVSLAVENGRGDGGPAVLRGRDARQQLVVTGKTASGQLRDLTREVSFQVAPATVATVDATGLVRPLADGRAKVTVGAGGGVQATAELIVERFTDDPPVNFPNQVVPVFTKFGCNSGGCHGKSGGQNGFRLSLLGFEPTEDYEHLVHESRGRRLFPAAPDRSLLLEKAVNLAPHGGGQRLETGAHEYRLLARWIAQGMPYGSAQDPRVERITVFPEARTTSRRSQQQIIVLAHYTDGTVEDVTRMAQYEANNTEMAEPATSGLVQTMDQAGEVAVMARYQGQVAVYRASVPLGAAAEQMPPAKNFVDELVFAKLKALGVPPSPPCDDATFIRRVTIDIAGRLPKLEETRAFLADGDPQKRERLVERLVGSGEYADYFANKWSAILRNKRVRPSYQRGTFGLHAWIRDSLYDNKPYDEFVREIVAASGDLSDNPPVSWYREVRTVEQQVEDTAQLFLGLRIQCARCHHHPFERWSQRDYYGFAAFFTQVSRKTGADADEQRIYHKRGVAASVNPKTGERLLPTGLGSAPMSLRPDDDPRQALVDWMAEPGNPFFAPSLVNRYWKHFFNRGLVDPEDDMRVTNPATNPELLAALSRHFVEHDFDLQDLVRTICRSQAYQLSSEPNRDNTSDKQNFSRFYPRRLTAEVLLDALDVATGGRTNFNGLPADTRAVQLPDSTGYSYFLTVFGRPEMTSACECERSQDANLAQSLHLLNSADVQGKLTGGGRAAALAKDTTTPPTEKVRTIYLTMYSREPTADELRVALTHLERAANKQQAYEDILWALANTKEFLFNH